MGTMQAEVFEAFRDMGATEDKALKAAAVLGKSGDEIAALRTDMGSRFSELKADMTGRFSKLETDMAGRFAKVDLEIAGVKVEQVVVRWMLGFVLATNVAILFKVFSH